MQNSYAIAAVRKHYPQLDEEFIASSLRYATFVSLKHRYLYFEVPKAACSALKQLLLEVEDSRLPDFDPSDAEVRQDVRRDGMMHERKNLAIKSLLDFDDSTQKEILHSPDFLRLVVVRNPYTRLVSAWRNKIIVCEPGYEYLYEKIKGGLPAIDNKELITFHEFFDYIERNENLDTCNPHWQRQTTHIFLPVMNFNFVGKTEKLADVLDRLQQHMGLPTRPKLVSSNVSGSPADPQLTAPIAERIHALYRQDFDNFGYDPNNVPKYQPGEFVAASVFHDEIIERNLVLAALYARLSAEREQASMSKSLARARDRLLGKTRRR